MIQSISKVIKVKDGADNEAENNVVNNDLVILNRINRKKIKINILNQDRNIDIKSLILSDVI